MTTTLIVLAHPERGSFNGAWANATAHASRDLGHEVIWSDLCSMKFDPVESRAHYGIGDPGQKFDPLKFQERASAADALPADVVTESQKIERADRIVFHFPLWWFSPPAILKGWLERVLAHGHMHDVGHRFDTGLCRGKTAMLCVTTGSSDAESSYRGKEGEAGMLLWPMAYTLRYLGFTVLQPVFAHGVHGYHRGSRLGALESRLRSVLAGQADLIGGLADRRAMMFNADDDFDERGQLKPDSPSHSFFIRQKP